MTDLVKETQLERNGLREQVESLSKQLTAVKPDANIGMCIIFNNTKLSDLR